MNRSFLMRWKTQAVRYYHVWSRSSNALVKTSWYSSFQHHLEIYRMWMCLYATLCSWNSGDLYKRGERWRHCRPTAEVLVKLPLALSVPLNRSWTSLPIFPLVGSPMSPTFHWITLLFLQEHLPSNQFRSRLSNSLAHAWKWWNKVKNHICR